MKLGNRLQQLDAMITLDYEHIWDCCCDHGLLGARLLDRKAASQTIHFVDIVPELIEKLRHCLQQFYPIDDDLMPPKWQVHCDDTARLALTQYSGRQLVIIAGVGGDQVLRFVESVVKNNALIDLDFLLCPVHHQYALREQLIALNFRLKAETLVEENNRYYELLLTSAYAHGNEKLTRLSTVGSDIWTCANSRQATIARNYLDKTLAHYQRIQHSNSLKASAIIESYKAVSITLCD